jgi:hypothetical protein
MLHTLVRAIQALMIAVLAGMMLLLATVLAALGTIFKKHAREKPVRQGERTLKDPTQRGR